jgi:hypothetical protein
MRDGGLGRLGRGGEGGRGSAIQSATIKYNGLK